MPPVGSSKRLAATRPIKRPEKERWSAKGSLAFSKLAITASTDVPVMVYDLMLPASMYDPTLTMGDIRSFDQGSPVSLQAHQPEYELSAYDPLGSDYPLPVPLVQGAGDRVSPEGLTRKYFDSIRAPRKEFFTVADAGHRVEFADTDRFLSVLRPSIE